MLNSPNNLKNKEPLDSLEDDEDGLDLFNNINNIEFNSIENRINFSNNFYDKLLLIINELEAYEKNEKSWILLMNSKEDKINITFYNDISYKIKELEKLGPYIPWREAHIPLNNAKTLFKELTNLLNEYGIKVKIMSQIEHKLKEYLVHLQLSLRTLMENYTDAYIKGNKFIILIRNQESFIDYMKESRSELWQELINQVCDEIMAYLSFDTISDNSKNTNSSNISNKINIEVSALDRKLFLPISNTQENDFYKYEYQFNISIENHIENHIEKSKQNLKNLKDFILQLGEIFKSNNSISSVDIFSNSIFIPMSFKIISTLYNEWKFDEDHISGLNSILNTYFDLIKEFKIDTNNQESKNNHNKILLIFNNPRNFIKQMTLNQKLKELSQIINSNNFRESMNITSNEVNQIVEIQQDQFENKNIKLFSHNTKIFSNSHQWLLKLVNVVEMIHDANELESNTNEISFFVKQSCQEMENITKQQAVKWIRKCSLIMLPKRLEDSSFVLHINTWKLISHTLSILYLKYSNISSFLQLSIQFRNLAKDFVWKYTEIIKASFCDEFGTQKRFHNIAKNEDQIEYKINQIIKGLNQLLYSLKNLETKYSLIVIGESISGIMNLIIDDICGVKDFASEECERIQKLMMPLIDIANDFIGSELKDECLEKWIKGFNIYNSISKIMTLKLVDIPILYHKGELPGLSADLVIQFIVALFSKTPNQEAAILAIKNSSNNDGYKMKNV